MHNSLQHVGRNCCYFLLDILFQIHHRPWFLYVCLALEISSEEEVLRLGTLVPMSIEVPTKYPLSHDRIVVFEIRLHSKSPMLSRRALKDKFPTPAVPLTAVLPNRQVFLPDPVYGRNILEGPFPSCLFHDPHRNYVTWALTVTDSVRKYSDFCI